VFSASACSIKHNHPDYTYPAASLTNGADWPKLAVTEELETAGATARTNADHNQADTDRLIARAAALRARAHRLRARAKP
jgi:hypothetical protein